VHSLAREETLAGGKGVNVARVLGQLGSPGLCVPGVDLSQLKTLLVGPLGGPTGDLQRMLLDAEHLASVVVPTAGWTRINEVIVDTRSAGSATVFNAAGPMITAEESERIDASARAAIVGASAVVCTGSIPPGLSGEVYGEWIRAGSAAGAITLLDSRGAALASGAAAHPTIVKVNRDEVDDLATTEGCSPASLIDSWSNGGTDAVVITDGDRPTTAVTPDGVFVVAGAQVPTVSAVGSGDAFTAGLVAARVSAPDAGWAWALRLAAACGASNAASTTARLAVSYPPAALLDSITIRRTEAPTW
jgi:fructose-1-phosphate kinase PfkB-like protein